MERKVKNLRMTLHIKPVKLAICLVKNEIKIINIVQKKVVIRKL